MEIGKHMDFLKGLRLGLERCITMRLPIQVYLEETKNYNKLFCWIQRVEQDIDIGFKYINI